MKPMRKETVERGGDVVPFPKSIPDKERGWVLDRSQLTMLMGRLSKNGLDRVVKFIPRDLVGRQLDNGYEAVWGPEKNGSAELLAGKLAIHSNLPLQDLPSAGLIVYDTRMLTYALYYDKEKRVVARAVVARLEGDNNSWKKLAQCIEDAY